MRFSESTIHSRIRLLRRAAPWVLAVNVMVPIRVSGQGNKAAEDHRQQSPVAIVVELISRDPKPRSLQLGVGIALADGTVLTCRHVLEGTYSCFVQSGDGIQRSVVGVVADDDASDLIIVRVEPSYGSSGGVQFSHEEPQLDSQVEIVRPRSGGGTERICGTIASVRQVKWSVPTICLACPAVPGWSGSPVFNGQTEIIAILQAHFGSGGENNTHEAVTADYIQRLPRRGETAFSVWAGRIVASGRTRATDAADAGTALLKQRDVAGAADRFRAAIAFDPTYRRAWRLLPPCLVYLGRNEEYLSALSEYLQLEPGDDHSWYLLGAEQLRLGYYRLAAKSLEQSIALNPTADAHYRLGWCYLYSNGPSEAITSLLRARDLGSQPTGVSLALGRAMSIAGNHAGAVDEFENAIKYEPVREELHTRLIVEHMACGESDAAKAAISRMATTVEKPARVMTDAGAMLAGLGRIDAAVKAYRIAIAHDESFVEAHRGLAQQFVASDNWPDVVVEAGIIQRLAPTHPSGFLLAGGACFAAGQFKEAIAAYKQAVSLDGGQPGSLFNLGLAQARAGEVEAARATAAELATKDPALSRAVLDAIER